MTTPQTDIDGALCSPTGLSGCKLWSVGVPRRGYDGGCAMTTRKRLRQLVDQLTDDDARKLLEHAERLTSDEDDEWDTFTHPRRIRCSGPASPWTDTMENPLLGTWRLLAMERRA